MANPYSLCCDPPVGPAGRLRAWGGALAVHGAAALALLLAWPQAGALLERVIPIEVRTLETERPPEPPPRRTPPPKVAEPLPMAPPPPVPVPPPLAPAPAPVLATTAATASAMVVPPAPARPVPAAEPVRHAPPAPEPLVEARFDADYLDNPRPLYPMASRRLGEAGTVHLRVHVGPEGQALKVELKSSSGFDRLDQSALEAVSRWHFVPARRGANPVASWVVVPIVFSLT